MIKPIFQDFAIYNHWANNKLLNRFKEETNEILTAKQENSFPSILKTWLHIWDAQVIWLARLQGESLGFFPSQKMDVDPRIIFDEIPAQSAEFSHFITQQPEEFFSSTITYSKLSGEVFQGKPQEMIHHCFNHSTYHRGQIITMAKNLKLEDLPSTDYIFYLRERN